MTDNRNTPGSISIPVDATAAQLAGYHSCRSTPEPPTTSARPSPPTAVVSDHHQPSSQAVRGVVPEATHVRTGPHRARGETTKGVERSHIATRDRLRASRGLKTPATGQRFVAGFEAVRALGQAPIHLERLVPGYGSLGATSQARAWAVVTAITLLGARLRRAT
jgi:DDE domain